jgi:4-hydroxybenzoate polyprenyltransferase
MSENLSQTQTEEDSVKMRYQLVAWLKTMRIQTGMVTSLALWVGFISVSQISIRSLLVLGCVGLFFHIFGFTLNEVEDKEYDKEMAEKNSYVTDDGVVHEHVARIVAWIAVTMSIFISAISGYPMKGSLILLLAIAPAVLYNRFSKAHWWSSIYLSVWAGLMVVAGAYFAGSPNLITWVIAAAISIQIFFQVLEGDLKDIHGTEHTFCERLGVELDSPAIYRKSERADAESRNKINGEDEKGVLRYTNKFIGTVYGLKLTEVGLLWTIPLLGVTSMGDMSHIYLTCLLIASIVFITTLSMVMTYVYDRSVIKKYSSMHELSSIILIGISVMSLDLRGGLLVAICPIVWYLVVNKTLHSGALNPDI